MRKNVCFFGPDGAGKTSLAKRLRAILEWKGVRVRVSWLRGTHTLASVLARLLSKFGAFRGPDNPYYGIKVPPGFRRLWWFLEFVSVLLVWLARFCLPRLFGWVVVGERGLLDFVVWVILTTRSPEFLRSLWGRAALALGLKGCVNVYVRAEESVLARRRGNSTSQTLAVQLALYDTLARAVGAPIVDTSCKSVRESLREILEIVRAYVDGRV